MIFGHFIDFGHFPIEIPIEVKKKYLHGNKNSFEICQQNAKTCQHAKFKISNFVKIIPHICHGHHGRCPWRKICHVEKFLHMTHCHVDKFSTSQIVTWEKFLHMQIVKIYVMWRNNVYNLSRILRCFVAKSVIFRFTLFCSEIDFVAIYALLRGEKLSQKL